MSLARRNGKKLHICNSFEHKRVRSSFHLTVCLGCSLLFVFWREREKKCFSVECLLSSVGWKNNKNPPDATMNNGVSKATGRCLTIFIGFNLIDTKLIELDSSFSPSRNRFAHNTKSIIQRATVGKTQFYWLRSFEQLNCIECTSIMFDTSENAQMDFYSR